MHRTKKLASALIMVLASIAVARASNHPDTGTSGKRVASSTLPPSSPIQDTCAPGFPEDVCAGPVETSPEEVIAYWTDERMKQATSRTSRGCPEVPVEDRLTPDGDACNYAPVPSPYDSNRVSRINGILFYMDLAGFPYTCSASVITSPGGNLILTAAHCLQERQSPDWYSMAMFVPAYSQTTEGRPYTPLGRWAIKQTLIPHNFISDPEKSDESDLAVALVYPSTQGSPSLQSVVGGAYYPRVSGESFYPDITMYGYPYITITSDGESVYGHGRQYFCISHTEEPSGNDHTALYTPSCPGAQGNSGGPITLLPNDPIHPETVVGVHVRSSEATRLTHSTFTPIYDAALELDDQP